MKRFFVLIFVLTFVVLSGSAMEPNWKSLFNGKNLDGWTVRGKATWVVKDGVLVGEGANGHIYAAPELTDLEEKGKFVLDDLYFELANSLCNGNPNTINQFLDDDSHQKNIQLLLKSYCNTIFTDEILPEIRPDLYVTKAK